MRTPVVLLSIAAIATPGRAQDHDLYRGEPIEYEIPTSRDPVSVLRRQLEAGTLELVRDERLGILPALLDALEVPVSSQALVFSKTSFQNARISPSSPRAIYFGDRTYVGYVPGSPLLELTSVDAEKGAIFYTLTDGGDGSPRIERNDGECLRCHAFAWTDGWPGHLVRSLHIDPDGLPIQRLGARVIQHDSAFEERWGGWYVTGTHGDMRHMGNLTHPEHLDAPEDPSLGWNVTDLRGRFDFDRYPSPHSDLVALMVLEHQTGMQNLIARASYEARLVLHRQRATNAAMGEDPAHLSDATRRKLNDLADELLQYLLFRNEPALPSPIRGTSSFAEEFSERGPRDRVGRTLRQLDLERRLFRWPCSYGIQSAEFLALPVEVRDVVMLRLRRILAGRFGRSSYRHLSSDDRREIFEILCDTVPELTAGWRDD